MLVAFALACCLEETSASRTVRGDATQRVDVMKRHCAAADCWKQPWYGMRRGERPMWCKAHAPPGARNVGDRECVREDLEVDDAVLNVPRVRVDGGRDNAGEVVGEVVLGVELRVLGAVAAPLLVLGAPGRETEEARAAPRKATEDLDEQEHDLVVFATKGVVVQS